MAVRPMGGKRNYVRNLLQDRLVFERIQSQQISSAESHRSRLPEVRHIAHVFYSLYVHTPEDVSGCVQLLLLSGLLAARHRRIFGMFGEVLFVIVCPVF